MNNKPTNPTGSNGERKETNEIPVVSVPGEEIERRIRNDWKGVNFKAILVPLTSLREIISKTVISFGDKVSDIFQGLQMPLKDVKTDLNKGNTPNSKKATKKDKSRKNVGNRAEVGDLDK